MYGVHPARVCIMYGIHPAGYASCTVYTRQGMHHLRCTPGRVCIMYRVHPAGYASFTVYTRQGMHHVPCTPGRVCIMYGVHPAECALEGLHFAGCASWVYIPGVHPAGYTSRLISQLPSERILLLSGFRSICQSSAMGTTA